MKKVILLLALSFLLPQVASAQNSSERFQAEISSIENGKITVQIIEGSQAGKEYPVILFDEKQIDNQQLSKSDYVLVSFSKTPTGEQGVIIVDHVRYFPLLVLLAVFIIVVILVGKLKGIMAFLGMIFSFIIIAQMIVPQIILGNNPVLIALLGSLFIIPVTFYIAHGFSRKTTIAVISTFLSLLLTGVLATIFVLFTKLTGFAAEEATFIQAAQGETINIRNLLLAGIIIGAMGVLDDVTISQTSIVSKLKKANPKYTKKELFKESMDVGRDHIASLVNTLILVYAGASLPLFVLFYSSQFGTVAEVINMEIVATEIVRTLVSSIGIIAAVPITTALAVWQLKE